MNHRCGAGGLYVAAVLLACGPSERPDITSGSTGESEGEMRFAEVSSPTARTRPKRVCEPGSTRACKYYYTDGDGSHHCPLSIQFCRSNGMGWQDCAQPYVDAGPPPDEAEEEMEPEPEPRDDGSAHRRVK